MKRVHSVKGGVCRKRGLSSAAAARFDTGAEPEPPLDLADMYMYMCACCISELEDDADLVAKEMKAEIQVRDAANATKPPAAPSSWCSCRLHGR